MESENTVTFYGLMTYVLMENETIKNMVLGYDKFSLAVNFEPNGEGILWFVAFPKKENMHGANKAPVLAIKICAIFDLPEPILPIFEKQFLASDKEFPNFDFFLEGMKLRCTKEDPIAMISEMVKSAQFIIKEYREYKEKGDDDGCYNLLNDLLESLLSLNSVPEEELKEIVRKHKIATGLDKE